MRVAFATCSAFPQGWEDDHPAARLLEAEYRCWDDPAVKWERYDRVVIRSTWDYTKRVEEFVAWSRRVGAELLRNVPDLVAFNADKRYLRELGVPSVPTWFLEPGETLPAHEGELVVKPNVSAGARETGRFGAGTRELAGALVDQIHASGRTALVQPYMSAIDERGETALVFLAGELSHVLRKQAVLGPDEVAPTAPGELGVARAMLREDLVGASACSDHERDFAQSVLDEITERFGTPLYARVDLVPDERGAPLLLELEAVEPNLYLAHSRGGAERLAAAVLAS